MENVRQSSIDRPSDLGLRSAMSHLENNQLPPSGDAKPIDESEDFLNQSFDDNHFIITAVSSYMRSSVFWCVAVGLCAMRAASSQAVFVAYFSLVFRII